MRYYRRSTINMILSDNLQDVCLRKVKECKTVNDM